MGMLFLGASSTTGWYSGFDRIGFSSRCRVALAFPFGFFGLWSSLSFFGCLD
jgi:hypothetical protein